MKLLVFLAKGFETIEFSAFIDVMGWAKTDFDCKIDVVTCGFNQKVISSFKSAGYRKRVIFIFRHFIHDFIHQNRNIERTNHFLIQATGHNIYFTIKK